ncbi:unnamed protein product [Caretta caretta]
MGTGLDVFILTGETCRDQQKIFTSLHGGKETQTNGHRLSNGSTKPANIFTVLKRTEYSLSKEPASISTALQS